MLQHMYHETHEVLHFSLSMKKHEIIVKLTASC